MSPTGQISPAIRFDRGVSFRARALQQGPFRANVLVCLLPFIHERKIVTYHAGDSKSQIEDRRRRASLLGQFFIRLAASSRALLPSTFGPKRRTKQAANSTREREGECVPFETIRTFPIQLCRVNDVTRRGVAYPRLFHVIGQEGSPSLGRWLPRAAKTLGHGRLCHLDP